MESGRSGWAVTISDREDAASLRTQAGTLLPGQGGATRRATDLRIGEVGVSGPVLLADRVHSLVGCNSSREMTSRSMQSTKRAAVSMAAVASFFVIFAAEFIP